MYFLIKSFVLPPGIIILMGVVGLFLVRRYPWWGYGLIALSFLILYLLSILPVAERLHRGLQPQAALTEQDLQNTDAQAIVVLGAARNYDAPEYGGQDTVGAALLVRLRYAAYLHRKTQLPILVTGGAGYDERVPEAEMMADVLENEFQVPVEWKEPKSLTTYENALFSREILGSLGIDKILVVTHAYHMPRSLTVFEEAGFAPIAAATSFMVVKESKAAGWLPLSVVFQSSVLAIHEHIGQLYYRWFGCPKSTCQAKKDDAEE